MFGRYIKCPKCRNRMQQEENLKYVKCECGHVFTNKYFVEPTFLELEFAKGYDLKVWPDSVFNIACEVEKTIQKIEYLGGNEVIVWFGSKVCQSKNETALMSNLTHMKNDIARSSRFNFKYTACSEFHKKCDYSYMCPIRAATYLYLYRKEYGDEAVKNNRKLSKIELSKNNTAKVFNWDVNNHSSEYVPTKTLKFIEKLLDNNYISFSHQSTENNSVLCISSKKLTFNNLEYLMKLSSKKLREELTTDLEVFTLSTSHVGTIGIFYLQHLAKYVEYLRRNHSYESFYKKQVQKEKEINKAKKVSSLLEKVTYVETSA